jgi:hypothetical protein
VLADDTHEVYVILFALIAAFGIPSETTSDNAAPVTDIVKSAYVLADVLGKSKVAEPVKPWLTVCLVVDGEKKRFVPLNSIAPASAVVRFVPLVNFNGAVDDVIVPAAR